MLKLLLQQLLLDLFPSHHAGLADGSVHHVVHGIGRVRQGGLRGGSDLDLKQWNNGVLALISI